MIIGVTGSSGAGKSTVCEMLQNEYNIKIVNADKIAKELSKKGTNYLKDIVKQFGTEILLENGELNRAKLAEIIYSDTSKREKLNECTFKHIKEEIKNNIKQIYNENEKAIIAIDAPLLYEAELDKICEFVIGVISVSRELQIERIVQRDIVTKKQAEDRLNAQKPNSFYVEKSQYSIINDGRISEIKAQIDKIFHKYINKN